MKLTLLLLAVLMLAQLAHEVWTNIKLRRQRKRLDDERRQDFDGVYVSDRPVDYAYWDAQAARAWGNVDRRPLIRTRIEFKVQKDGALV
jgi:hypothetical protein